MIAVARSSVLNNGGRRECDDGLADDRSTSSPDADQRRSMGMAQAVQRCFEAAGGRVEDYGGENRLADSCAPCHSSRGLHSQTRRGFHAE